MSAGSSPRSAPIPLAAPAARPVAYLVTTALTAIGIISGHDWLAGIGVIERPEIIAGFVDWLDGYGWDAVLLPASVFGILVGAALLFVAVTPRRRTHIRGAGDADQWLRPVDVGRIASRAARRCPGVFDATALAGGRTVTVTVHAGGETGGRGVTGGTRERDGNGGTRGNGSPDDGGLPAKVRATVTRELESALDVVPDVKVRILRPSDGVDRRHGKGAGSR